MKTDTLKSIPLLLPLIFILYYYMSYNWIYKWLKEFDLEMSGIIVTEDLLFHFGEHNQFILTILLMGFLIVLCIALYLKPDSYNRVNEILLEDGRNFASTIKFIINSFKKKWHRIAFVTGFLILLIVATYVYIILKNPEIPSSKLGGVIFVMMIVIPVMYLVWVPKRNLIAILYIIGLFYCSNLTIDHTIQSVLGKKATQKTELSFTYEGKEISTTPEIQIIYEGYKYILMKNYTTGKNLFYERNLVTHLTKKVTNL